jgi:hypothetical protein
MRRQWIGLIALTVLAVLLAPVGVAWAQEPTPTLTPAPTRPATVRGTLTAIRANGFTLQTERWGDLEVRITEGTRFRVPGFVRADLSDVRVGDSATVHGRWIEEGRALEAHWVIVRAPTQVRHGTIQGIDVSARRTEVKTRAGEVIPVEWTERTRLHVTGVLSPTWSDLGAGYPVTVIGHFVQGTFLAGRVVSHRPRHLFQGTLQGIEGTTLIIQTRSGETVSVRTNEHTRIRTPVRPHAALGDLQVGDAITVWAVGQPDGSWLARLVVARSPRAPKPAQGPEKGPGKGPAPTRRP